MKYILPKTFIAVLLALILSSCAGVDKGSSNGSRADDTIKKTDVIDELEVLQGPLTKVGQWTKESDGTKITLKKMATIDKEIDMNPIKLKLYDVKLLERAGGETDGNIIQISYSGENTSEQEIMFTAINVITTNTKRQIDVFSENLNLGSATKEYYGQVIHEDYVIVPYPEQSFDDLTSLKIITGDVWDRKDAIYLHEAITEDVAFD